MLHDVGVTTTIVYVNDVRPYFNPENESNTRSFQNTVLLESQDTITGGAATALVSTAGTVSSIDVTVSGVGYTAAPERRSDSKRRGRRHSGRRGRRGRRPRREA